VQPVAGAIDSLQNKNSAWNAFVAASPYGDVLQCEEWGQVKQPEWQPLLVQVEDSGRLQASALVLRRALPRTNRNILYVPRGPILDWSQPAIARALTARLREVAQQQNAILIKIDPAVPAATPGMAQTLRELGFQPSPDASGGFGGTQPRCVMKLDINGTEDEVMARFHQKWRYNIRLAERKGVRVVSDCTRDDLKIFHDIYRVTAQRDGFTGRPLAYFEKLWDVLVTKDLAKLFVTYHNETPLSAAICFILRPQCWYVYGASSNEHRNLMPNHAMQWAMIRWAREQGCSVYDFRGVHDVAKSADGQAAPTSLIDSPDGLVRFKAGFGAELVEYIGEWDLPLNKSWYWLWTTARPKLVAAMKNMKGRG
jgi:lipid II:glycine glycyltransferase (peptidoglycan interpeptide bridge formation enzyme)